MSKKYKTSSKEEHNYTPLRAPSGEWSSSIVKKEDSFILEQLDPTLYENNAAPKLRVVIVVADDKNQIDDALILQHTLKRERIRSSIFVMSSNKHRGLITMDEIVLSNSIKSSCAVITLDPDTFKWIALRTWTAGRHIIAWFSKEVSDNSYLVSKYTSVIKRIGHIGSKVRSLKSEYTKDIIQNIKRSVFLLAEFKS
jgi:hypothetical protein